MIYTHIDDDGYVIGYGDSDAAPEGNVVEGVHPPMDMSRRWQWVDGVFVDAGPKFPQTYTSLRRSEYPPIGDQLDMLWHAMDDGLIPKVEPLYSNVKAVKEKYPKNC